MRTAIALETPLAQLGPELRSEVATLLEQVDPLDTPRLTISVGTESQAVPAEVTDLFFKIISQLASGCMVGVYTVPEELTSTTAANMLGISRPTLMKLVHSGEIEAYKVGTHTRIKLPVLMEYMSKRNEQRAAALEQLLDDGDI